MKVLLVSLLVALATATVYFKDDFSDPAWEKRWVVSTSKPESDRGTWDLSAGNFFQDADSDKGLHTSQDARFYQISTEFPEFSNKGKDLVLQFSVKHQQKIDCGGGYIKLLPAGLDQASFNGDSPYNIMFGPDICGSATRRIHVIFNRRGSNHLINKNIACETDEFTHVYTLVVKPDNTYQVLVDGSVREKGSLEDDWSILPPKKINDPSVSKPADWVDEKFMDDPEDKKPEGYDDIPAQIADPEAKKPSDWDDELDGEWEAPMIPNPEFKGPWRAKRIENPAYKGEWEHPQIDNPEFKADPDLYAFDSHKYLGIEIWQVKSGTIFDNFLVTDSEEEAEADRAKIEERREAEKAQQKKKQEEEEAARKAEEEANKAEEGDVEKPDL